MGKKNKRRHQKNNFSNSRRTETVRVKKRGNKLLKIFTIIVLSIFLLSTVVITLTMGQ